jgi:hypothetical protein
VAAACTHRGSAKSLHPRDDAGGARRHDRWVAQTQAQEQESDMNSAGVQMSVQQVLAVAPATVTPGRIVGTIAALAAIAGVVIGWRSMRAAGRNGRGGAFVALAAGLIGLAMGTFVVAAAKGGPGTGYGIVGGVAALAIGLVATVLGGMALGRSRRTS